MSDATYVDLINLAAELGREAGEDAASWYFDSKERPNPQAHAERIIIGINDGDPEILDTFNYPNLSGEWADSTTPQSLARYLGLEVDGDPLEHNIQDNLETLADCCTAWEDAASEAVERIVLRDAYRIVIPEMLEGARVQRSEADANWRHLILEASELADMTQATIGTHAGVSQQRIAQILSNNNDEKGTA